jgi:hypothetical protein
MAARTHFHRGHLGNVEQGKREASPQVIAAYEGVLADVQRREFLGLAASVALPAPTYVGPGELRELHRRVLALEEWDRRSGGGTTAHLAMAELDYATRLRAASSTPAVRAAVSGAVANMADAGAWAAFDAGDKASARRTFALGIAAARESNDPNMIAHVQSGLARLEIEDRNPQEAVDLAASRPGVAPLVDGMLAMVRAQAHAALGDRRAALAALQHAERVHAQRGDLSEAPVWLGYFTDAKLSADAGLVLWRMRDRECQPLLASSAAGLTTARARTKAIASAQLATALFRDGQAEEGRAWVFTARRVGGAVRSARFLSTLKEAERLAKGFGMVTKAAEGRVWQAGAEWVAEVGSPPDVSVIGTRGFESREDAEKALRDELADRFPGVEPQITVWD